MFDRDARRDCERRREVVLEFVPEDLIAEIRTTPKNDTILVVTNREPTPDEVGLIEIATAKGSELIRAGTKK